MILFKEDFDYYPDAIIDLETTNQSFINLAAIYKEMGIANHSFILTLLDPELQGVDPFSPNLTTDQIYRIIIECKKNPWYYFREIALVPAAGLPEPVRFIANRGNIALYWLFFNHITVILIQIRQTGKSVANDELNIYLENVHCVNTDIVLLTKDEDLRSKNLRRLKDIQECLPFYLNKKGKNDIFNTEEFRISALNNTFKAMLGQSSEKAALKVGRGMTSPITGFDEAAFIQNIAIAAPAALAAGTMAKDIARKMGTPYGTVFTTTSGKKDDRDGKYIFDMLEGAAEFNESFYDTKDSEELELVIRKNSSANRLNVGCVFNHRQLGYTDAWLKQAIEDTQNQDLDSIRRDFFNEWTSGSLTSPLSRDILERIKKSELEPIHNEITKPYGYIIKWYIPLEQIDTINSQSFWIFSVDSSDTIGNDDTCITIRDIRTGSVVAAGVFNETNIYTLTEFFYELIKRFENMVTIVEARSSGRSIMDQLIIRMINDGINPFKKIFNRIVNDSEDYRDAFKEISRTYFTSSELYDIANKYKRHFGFATSGSGLTSRTELYSTTLINSAKYTGDFVHDKKTIRQIMGLINKNGRIDHADGEHDDTVIAWLLGYWLMSNGKGLDFYGLDSRMILRDNPIYNKSINDTYNVVNQEQLYLQEQIEMMVEKLAKEKNVVLIQSMESRLASLFSRLKEGYHSTISYDELINRLRDNRRNQAKQGYQ